jgi:hypothetical protein
MAHIGIDQIAGRKSERSCGCATNRLRQRSTVEMVDARVGRFGIVEVLHAGALRTPGYELATDDGAQSFGLADENAAGMRLGVTQRYHRDWHSAINVPLLPNAGVKRRRSRPP